MKKILVGVLSAALVLGATSAFAGTKAGDKEVGAAFAISRTSYDYEGAEDDTDVMIMATGSYFVTDALAVGIGVSGNANYNDSGDSKSMAVFAEPNYHFNTTSMLVPYAGVHAGMFMFQSEDTDETVFDYGCQGGVKAFITEAVALNTQLRYDRFEVVDITISKIELNIGLVYLF